MSGEVDHFLGQESPTSVATSGIDSASGMASTNLFGASSAEGSFSVGYGSAPPFSAASSSEPQFYHTAGQQAMSSQQNTDAVMQGAPPVSAQPNFFSPPATTNQQLGAEGKWIPPVVKYIVYSVCSGVFYFF